MPGWHGRQLGAGYFGRAHGQSWQCDEACAHAVPDGDHRWMGCDRGELHVLKIPQLRKTETRA